MTKEILNQVQDDIMGVQDDIMGAQDDIRYVIPDYDPESRGGLKQVQDGDFQRFWLKGRDDIGGGLNDRRGFTLVELIIVIAIVAILAGAIFVAIDPARRLHEARNARRSSDVSNILDAIKKYQADNSGDHYEEVADLDDDTYYGIGTDGGDCTGCTVVGGISECVDLEDIGGNYLSVVPYDPKDGDENNTEYYLYKSSEGSITIGACGAEGEGAGGSGDAPAISVTR